MTDRTRRPWCWGATSTDIAGAWPCDGLLAVPHVSLYRAVNVGAPPAVVYRWVCQLKVAPYSYDWLDNFGRRSPRELTPGAGELAVGQRMMVFKITAFEHDRHITGVGLPSAARIFGAMAVSYTVRAAGQRSSRLAVRLDAGGNAPLGRLRRGLLAWGDLVMMRKQLLTLKELAERHASG